MIVRITKNINLQACLLLLIFGIGSQSVTARERKREITYGMNSSCVAPIQTGISYGVDFQDVIISNNVVLGRKTSIEISIDDFAGPFYWYEATLQFKITPKLVAGGYGTPFDIELVVANNRIGNFGNFTDLNKYLINDINYDGALVELISFNILNRETGLIESTLPDNLLLKLGYEEEKYYELPSLSITPTASINSDTNTIDVLWNSVNEAEEYELEWTWIDDYAPGAVTDILAPNVIKLTNRFFELNNTRVKLKGTSYSIPLIYDRGYVVYRLRTIGRFIDANPLNSFTASRSNFYSEWSSGVSPCSFVSDWPDKIQVSEHNSSMNWQFQASYAEEGKKKDVVSYFDGSLRTRQTVTKSNTNEKAIVGETIYDEEGRAAIEVLPVPINNPAIQFYPNFNLNFQDENYSYQDFSPLTGSSCFMDNQGMSASSGSSFYYSDSNPQQYTSQDFIPNALKYPFSQIQYTADNTGRIARKSGVGPEHKIGTHHEMKYFYSVPTQEELNRIFGYQVGNVQHYKKNIVVDPNSQVSISYLDPQGRTIATALGGDSPDNMVALSDSELNAVVNKFDLLNKINDNDADTDLDNNVKYVNNFGNLFDGLRYDAQKVNTQSSTSYSFQYDLNINKAFHFQCQTESAGFYYPFVYKLNIDFKDECGNPILDGGGHATGVFNANVGSYNWLNPTVSSTTSTGYSQGFNFTPEVGAFGISKRLVVDEVALNHFADDFIERSVASGCLPAITEITSNIDGCMTTCEACVAQLMGYQNIQTSTTPSTTFTGRDAYVHAMLDSNFDLNQLEVGSPAYTALIQTLTTQYINEFALLLENCTAPCQQGIAAGSSTASLESISCSNSINQLIADMLPSGQYGVEVQGEIPENGQTTPTTGSATVAINDLPLSIYNETNQLLVYVDGLVPSEKSWRFPHYFNKSNFNLDLDVNGLTNDDYKHYFNEIGQIEFVPVTWDSDNQLFDPLIQGVNTPAELTALFPNSVVDEAAGKYQIEPQFLRNVEDFIERITAKEYWALSLIKYHPEYHYFAYQYGYCNSSYNKVLTNLDLDYDLAHDDTVTVNSDGFDDLVQSIDTYQHAVASGFFDNVFSLYANDPFFQNEHPLDGTVISQTGVTNVVTNTYNSSQNLRFEFLKAKKAIMLRALDKTDGTNPTTEGYDGTHKRLVRAAYDMVACSGVGYTCNFPNNLTSFADVKNMLDGPQFTDDERNRFWGFYKSYYFTLKQKIQHAFINLHATRQGFYNDVIGNNHAQNFQTITSVLSDYNQQRNLINGWRGNTNIPGFGQNLGNYHVGTFDMRSTLEDFEKRFLPYDGFYDSESSNGQNYNNLLSQANTNYYLETGNCPMVRDLEAFFSYAVGYSKMIPVFNGSPITLQPMVNFITAPLLSQLGGDYNRAGFLVNPSTFSTDNKTITFDFYQPSSSSSANAIVSQPITLTIPNTTSVTWSGYGNTWKIDRMWKLTYIGVTTTSPLIYSFKILAKIRNISTGASVEQVFEGTTRAMLTCSTNPSSGQSVIDLGDSPNCEVKNTFMEALSHLLTSLNFAGTINSPNANISTNVAFTGGYLNSFFDVHTGDVVEWRATTGHVYQIWINNQSRFELNFGTDLLNFPYVNLHIGVYTYQPSVTIPSGHQIYASVTGSDGVTEVFNGEINNGRDMPLHLTCCDPCGDIDADGDGIGDDGVFGQNRCDVCDSRIDTNHDNIPDCDCANTECNLCIRRRVAFVYSVPFSDNNNTNFTCTNVDHLARELTEFIENHNSTINPTHRGFDYLNCDISDSGVRLGYKVNLYSGTPSGYLYSNPCDDKNVYPNSDLTRQIIKIQNNQHDNAVNNLNIQLQNYVFNSSTTGTLAQTGQTTHPLRRYDLVFYFINKADAANAVNFRTLFDSDGPSDQGRGLRPFFIFITDNNGNILVPNGSATMMTPVNYLTPILTQIHAANNNIGQAPVLYNGPNRATANYCTFTQAQFDNLAFVNGLGGGVSAILDDIFDSIQFTSIDEPDFSCFLHSQPVTATVTQQSCPCNAEVPLPVPCDVAYTDYMNYMTTHFGANDYETRQYEGDEGKIRFCNANLQYLVDGYKIYLDTFGVTSTDSSEGSFITIAAFGATQLNFGYKDYANAIMAYHSYYAACLTNSIEPKSWESFIAQDYLPSHPEICPPKPMIPMVSDIIHVENNCIATIQNLDQLYNQDSYNAFLQTKREEFIKQYLEEATNDVIENFTEEYQDKEYQYTLYYYDQAGNLIQTVAPEGVNRLSPDLNSEIDNFRLNHSNEELNALAPNHRFKTQYKYNTLNQLVYQSTPDGGVTKFAYDSLGRIVASQNDKQRNYSTISFPTYNLQAGLGLVTVAGTPTNTIVKSINNNSWDNSAGVATQSVYYDGSVEYTLHPESSNAHGIIVGLSYSDNPVAFVNYGFYYGSDSAAHIIIFGDIQPAAYTVGTGDVYKIKRSSGYIQFYQNQILLYETEDHNDRAPMFANFAINDFKSKIYNLKIQNVGKEDFSYTCYDKLGRIREAGQFRVKGKEGENRLIIDDIGKLMIMDYVADAITPVNVTSVYSGGNYPHDFADGEIEVTKTLYDDYAIFTPATYLSSVTGATTRGRVTGILTFASATLGTPLYKFETAIFYNYDIHGNVSEMAQVLSPNIMSNSGNGNLPVITNVDYEYDLISGNVNKVIFQKGKPDQFIHKYQYDADNRIVAVNTSADDVIWEKDAEYKYYEHGPLAKVILGDKKVQGIDYAYTIQGWLKAVNSENLTTINKDMGRDGNYVSKDAYGYSLSYFNNDYQAIHQGTNQAFSISTNTGVQSGTGLFNGNINRMITTVRDLNERALPAQSNLYAYDQLNRIMRMDTQKVTPVGNNLNAVASYSSAYSYDRNGNLANVDRIAPLKDGSTPPLDVMDKFEYHYNLNTNQLNYITDDANSSTFDTDIDNQNQNNYRYDPIGELVADEAERIEKIDWRVDGKVKSVSKPGVQYLFFYDGLGNRVAKRTMGERIGLTNGDYYARDAQGNVLGVYETHLDEETNTRMFELKEHHLYGSSRLGIQEYNAYKKPNYFSRLVGDKRFELANHLGNVLNVINDRKITTSRIRHLFTDFFNNRKLHWNIISEENGKVFITKEEYLKCEFLEKVNNGIKQTLELDKNQTVIFQFKIDLSHCDLSVPVELRITNSENVLLSSTVITSSGVFTHSFDTDSSDKFNVQIISRGGDIGYEGDGDGYFTVDDFYAYVGDVETDSVTTLFLPDVISYADYYPFGSLVPNRHEDLYENGYRYGFNDKEKDNEIKGEGNSYDFGARMYDPRIGRWFSKDPKESKYPSNSTYNFALNNPILYIDVDGEDIFIPTAKAKSSYAGSKYDHLKQVGNDAANVAFTPFKDTDVNAVLREIQKGTNDKLYLKPVINNGHKIGYTVEIDPEGCANDAFSYPEGSTLVRDLITDEDHTTSIAKSNIKGGQKEGHGQNVYLPNGNSLVNFNMHREADDEHEGILNSDGSYGRPAFIGLYHEFGHGKDYKDDVPLDIEIIIYNPDSYPKYKIEKTTTEELSNRVRENKIRNEHKKDKKPNKPAKQRATPKVMPNKS